MKIVATTQVFPKAASLLQKSLEDLLSNHGKFLLFVSGGSAVNVYTKLTEWWRKFDGDLSRCAVALVDERFGKPDHNRSNAVAIEKSGLFAMLRKRGVRIETILHGGSMEDEVERYNQVVQKLLLSYSIEQIGKISEAVSRNFSTVCKRLAKDSGSLPKANGACLDATAKILPTPSDFTIGIFGIGKDGHTAGIFPSYAKASEDKSSSKSNFVKTYENGAYVVGHEYGALPQAKRITITPYAIQHINQILLIAQGESKALALQRFKCLSYEERYKVPAVVLKKAKSVTLVTDQEI